MQLHLQVWTLQFTSFAGEAVGRRGVLTHRIEHEVKLALPTYQHVKLPTCASVLDTLLFNEVACFVSSRIVVLSTPVLYDWKEDSMATGMGY